MTHVSSLGVTLADSATERVGAQIDNDTRLDKFMALSRELGRDMAAGKDSLPKWAMAVATAARDGVISTEKDHNGEDDITRAYLDLMKSASKKAIHEHTTGGLKANVSKARQIAVAAIKPTCDFVETLERTHAKRAEMIKANEKVRPAYHAYVEAARAQGKQDDDLSDEQIVESIRKPEADAPTEESILTGIQKKLEKLISGDDGVKSDDEAVIKAEELVRERLQAIVYLREVGETRAKAVKLGLIPVDQLSDDELLSELAA